MDELSKSLSNLKRVRSKIQKEFAGLEDSVLRQFLGQFDSPELRQSVRKYGDGHFLYSLPRSVKQLQAIDGVVLFAMTSPKLAADSNFNPFTPLHTIPYWDGRIQPLTQSRKSGRKYRLHFMAWQQNFHIHGKNDPDARKNLRLLLNHRPVFRALFQEAEDASREFIYSCRDWLLNQKKPMVVISHKPRKTFKEPVSVLIDDPSVIDIKATLWGKYWGNNFSILRLIDERLL